MENINEKKVNFELVQKQVYSKINGYEVLGTLKKWGEREVSSFALSNWLNQKTIMSNQNANREKNQVVNRVREVRTKDEPTYLILSEMGIDLSKRLIIDINQKHQLLLRQLEQVYKAKELEKEIANIEDAVYQTMEMTSSSEIELKKINKILTELLNRVLELVHQAEFYRQRDELKNKDELTQRRYLDERQALLESKYGAEWLKQMTSEEQKHFIGLYAMVNYLSEEEAKMSIEQLMEQHHSALETDLQYYEVLVTECFQASLTMLQELKENLNDNELQIAEFKRLYNKLREVNKIIPKTSQEAERKYEIMERINAEIEELQRTVKLSK